MANVIELPMPEVAAYYRKCKNYKKVGERYGVNGQTIKTKLLKYGEKVHDKIVKEINIPQMIEMYNTGYSPNYIAKFFGVGQKRIVDELNRQEIVVENRNNCYFSMLERMALQSHWNITPKWISQFEDLNRYKFLLRMINHNADFYEYTDEEFMELIEHFYNSPSFNIQYDIYQETKRKDDVPSFDHIIPISRGGTNKLDNLQVLSWFENRAKGEMTMDEYINMVRKYHGL